MSTKRLMRASKDRMIAGVCSGLAHYFGIDPTLVRLGFLIALLAAGTGPLLYIILWIVMPASDSF